MPVQPTEGKTSREAAAPRRGNLTPAQSPASRPDGANPAAPARGRPRREARRLAAEAGSHVVHRAAAPPRPSATAPPRPAPFPGGTLGAAPNCAGRPGVSVREGRAKRRPGRAWAGALVGGMRCGVQGTKWRRLHPFTLFPYLGVRAERDSDRCWGRGAAAAKEGRGFPSVGLGDDGG